MRQADNINVIDATRIWERMDEKLDAHTKSIGSAEARLTNVEAQYGTVRQDFTGHKAQMYDLVKEIRDDNNKFREDIQITLKSISKRLNKFNKFQWTIMVGGGVVAAMMCGLTYIAWQLLTNHDKIKWIWGGA